MNAATILALALKYGPSIIGLISQYGPLVVKYADRVIAAASVVDDASHKNPMDAMSAFVGQLAHSIPELKQFEPVVLKHIQDNGDAAIRLQEQMERNG